MRQLFNRPKVTFTKNGKFKGLSQGNNSSKIIGAKGRKVTVPRTGNIPSPNEPKS